MKRFLRWTGIAAGWVVALILIACAVLYFLSERALRRTYPIPAVTLTVPTDDAAIAEGQRLTAIHDCFGCHGKQGAGAVMFDEPMIARLVAPSLPAAVRKYSDAELAAIVRNGVRPGGRSMLVMPSEAFVELTDQDLGCIIAYLRTLPMASGPAVETSIGPAGRAGVAMGKFKVVAELIAETVPPPAATTEEAKFGRYLARTVCGGCHGASLRGASNPEFTSPSLQAVTAYSPEAFARLMRTGVPLGERKLKTMGPAAEKILSNLNDAEVAALYSYLHAMPPPGNN